jgi:hypothetical protein
MISQSCGQVLQETCIRSLLRTSQMVLRSVQTDAEQKILMDKPGTGKFQLDHYCALRL